MVSTDQYRSILGQFATGVTIVTVNANGKQHGMTVNSFASLSIDPPLVLFNADRGTNTHDMVQEAEHYAVNILTEDQQWLSDRFAGSLDGFSDPFEDVAYSTAETGAPILDDAIAYADCTLWDGYDGGDHTIYVGEIESCDVLNEDERPLTFFRGEYGTIH